MRVEPDHRGADIFFRRCFLHVLGKRFRSLVATDAEITLERFTRCFKIFILEQKCRVDSCFRLILVMVWRDSRVLMTLQAISRLAETVDVLDVNLLRQTAALNVQQIEVFLPIVDEKGNASLLLERALLHIQSHCHFCAPNIEFNVKFLNSNFQIPQNLNEFNQRNRKIQNSNIIP